MSRLWPKVLFGASLKSLIFDIENFPFFTGLGPNPMPYHEIRSRRVGGDVNFSQVTIFDF